MSDEETKLKPARLGRALKLGFQDTWDRIGLVAGASIILSVAVVVPMWAVSLLHWKGPVCTILGLAVALLVSCPVLAGIFRMAHNIVYREDPSLLDIGQGFTDLLRGSLGLAVLDLVVTAVLVTDIAFFFGIIGPLKGNRVASAVGILSTYVLLMWVIGSVYQFPSLAAQKPMGQRSGALAAVKKSLLLALGSPGFTIGIFVVILGLSILSVLSRIGMLILFAGTVSILLTHAERDLFIRYGIVEEPPEAVEDRGWRISD